MNKMNRQVLCVALAGAIFAGVVALYAPSVRHDLIRHDDPQYICTNLNIRCGLTSESVRWAFTSVGYASNWHPLAWLSLEADVNLTELLQGGRHLSDEEWAAYGGMRAKVMHGHNVLLHALNAVLLFVLLVVVAGRAPPLACAALALAWAVHPLRVEVVCWVSERKELVSVLFMLLSLIVYFRPSRSFGNYCLSLALFALALLAKPVAVSLPAVIFAWDWIFGGRIRWRRFVPFAALSAVTCGMTLLAQAQTVKESRDFPWAAWFANVFGSPLVYLQQTVWPGNLYLGYPITMQFTWASVALTVAGVVFVLLMAGVGVFWLMKRDRWSGLCCFLIAWAYVGLLPMLGIVKVGCEEHADRYTYWITCGACVSAAIAVGWLWERRDFVARHVLPYKDRFLYGTLAILTVLCFLSRGLIANWRDTITLYRRSVAVNWNPYMVKTLASSLFAVGTAQARMEAGQWLWEGLKRSEHQELYVGYAEYLMDTLDLSLDGIVSEDPLSKPERYARIALELDPTDPRPQKILKRIGELRKERK